jgi:hypothetical protein
VVFDKGDLTDIEFWGHCNCGDLESRLMHWKQRELAKRKQKEQRVKTSWY